MKNISEQTRRTGPVLRRNSKGEIGVVMVDLDTKKDASGWLSVDDPTIDLKPYLSDKGKDGVRLDPAKFAEREKAAAAKAKAAAEAKAKAEAEAKAAAEAKPEAAKPEAAKPEAAKVEPTKGPKLVWNKDRMDFDGPETTATSTPKPEPAKVEPTPTPTSAPKPEGVSAGLKKWASIYGPGGPKQLKQFTPSQRRLFRYTHPSTEKTMEAYDVVLDYLLSEGHADTVEEAHYVMMQLDSEYVQEVIQERAWWDPAGLFTKTDKEKALEKPMQGYDPNKGTTRLGPEGGPYTDRIIAPRGNVPGAMVKGKPETWRALTDKAASELMPRYKAVRGKTQLAKDVRDNAAAAEIAKLEAQAKAQQAKLSPGDAARETLAPAPIIAPKPKPAPVVAAKPKPKPAPVVATAQPTPTPAVAKRPSILSNVDDLKRMRAASLMRQQGRTLPGGKIPVGSDLKPKP